MGIPGEASQEPKTLS